MIGFHLFCFNKTFLFLFTVLLLRFSLTWEDFSRFHAGLTSQRAWWSSGPSGRTLLSLTVKCNTVTLKCVHHLDDIFSALSSFFQRFCCSSNLKSCGSVKCVCVLTAPEECSPQMKQLRTKQIPKTTAGYRVAVCSGDREASTSASQHEIISLYQTDSVLI